MAQDNLIHKLVIVIGGSAGSLSALLRMFEQITHAAPPPLVLVLHRKAIADTLLVELLSVKTHLTVKEAEEKEMLVPGTVYITPADYHLLLESDGTISLDDSEKVNYSRPSIDVTFESAAMAYGNKVVAILLSGANADGVEGLKLIKETGGQVIVQDPSTAEIPFMPEQAISHGFTRLLSPTQLGYFIDGCQTV